VKKIIIVCQGRTYFPMELVFAWNSLPDSIIESVSINNFKVNLETFNLERVLCEMKKIKTYCKKSFSTGIDNI
jgi:hypothetical protein